MALVETLAVVINTVAFFAATGAVLGTVFGAGTALLIVWTLRRLYP
jgi:hypothetical protein